MSRLSLSFLRRRRPQPPRAALPQGLRVYAVGDVHGRLDCLLMMEQVIARDVRERPPAGEALVIFLGDYIDRGSDSRGVVNVLIRRNFAGLAARFLLGNHEDAMLNFIGDASTGDPWFAYGGLATLASYGVRPLGDISNDRLTRLRDGLVAVLPPPHLAFINSLELAIEIGGFLFVHAGVRPGRELVDQRREDLLTIREPFLASSNLAWRVVHGHTIFNDAAIGPNRISLDTGAYATGRLSCAVIEGESVDILQAMAPTSF